MSAGFKYFQYRECPVSEKLAKAFSHVTTPYAVMCADDDFLAMSGLKACLEFLERNPEYSSAQGRCISFLYKKGKIRFSPTYLKNIRMDVSSDIPSERIIQQFSPYMNQFYSLHRTRNLRLAWNISRKINDLRLPELTIGMVAAINGKHSILPVFYSVRESIEGSTGTVAKKTDFINPDEDSRKDYSLLASGLARHLMTRQKLGFSEAKAKINRALMQYMKFSLSYSESFKSRIIRLIEPRLPWLSKLMRRAYAIITEQKDLITVRNWKSYSFKGEELDEMSRLVIKHNISKK